MSIALPPSLETALLRADRSWHAILRAGLAAVAQRDADYLPALASSDYLPTDGRLFAAFAQPFERISHVLIGEGPYPRAASATGVCFMDGAVTTLWSANGLSKAVNRATSLRNFIKMLLVADHQLDPAHTSGNALAGIAERAQAADSELIQTLQELQTGLTQHGFLLLNATLVFRPEVRPRHDAQAWQPLLQVVLNALLNDAERAPTLVLWGKIAADLQALPNVMRFPQACAEHPYNLSFIQNATMQQLFGPLRLLQKPAK